MMYLVPKQLYSAMSQYKACESRHVNRTEFGSAENVKIYNSCSKETDDCAGNPSPSDNLPQHAKERGQTGFAVDVGPGDEEQEGGLPAIRMNDATPFRGNPASAGNVFSSQQQQQQQQQPASQATQPPNAAALSQSASTHSPLPPPPPAGRSQVSSFPTVMPIQTPQSFYPQTPIIHQAAPSQQTAPDPVLASPQNVEQILPDERTMPNMPEIMAESQAIIKEALLEERQRMFEMLKDVREDIQRQQRSIESTAIDLRDGQVDIQNMVSRMSSMLQENYTDLQRSLEVQKGLIREHAASIDKFQNSEANMRDEFAALGGRLRMDIIQAFNPVLQQLEAESRSIRERDLQLWARNFEQLKSDLSDLNMQQFQMLHGELKTHYSIWSREIQSDFQTALDLERSEWQRRLAMVTNAVERGSADQFISLRKTLIQTITNIHHHYNRIEINVFDDRFRQLEELFQQYQANAARNTVQAAAAVAADPAQLQLPAPPNNPPPAVQPQLPAPAATLALPAPDPSATAIPLPPPPAISQTPIPLPAPQAAAAAAQPTPSNLPPSTSSSPSSSYSSSSSLIKPAKLTDAVNQAALISAQAAAAAAAAVGPQPSTSRAALSVSNGTNAPQITDITSIQNRVADLINPEDGQKNKRKGESAKRKTADYRTRTILARNRKQHYTRQSAKRAAIKKARRGGKEEEEEEDS
jgi:hypothetical protein